MPSTNTPDIVLSGLAPVGNRCNHDPKNPRLELDTIPTRRGKLPLVLQKCLDNLQAYYYDRSILRPLAELDVSEKKVTAGKRSNRSEAREAEVLIISAILHSMDLTSLLVGVPNEKYGFVHKSTYELAKMAGLLDPETDEPHGRFKRTMSRIRRSGMMETTRTTFKSASGEVRAGVGIKRVSEDFVVMLMGGTKRDRTALQKMRESHYAKTRHKRVKGSSKPTAAQERDALADKMMTQAKEASIAKAQAKAVRAGATKQAVEAMNPESHQQAYSKARQQFQKQCLDGGLDLHAFKVAMTNFPTVDNWNP